MEVGGYLSIAMVDETQTIAWNGRQDGDH